MSRLPLRAAWKMALMLTASGLAALIVASAACSADEVGTPLLPDRPDIAEATGNVLGPLYINHTAGIEFHVPAGSKKVLQVSQDLLAEFDEPDRKWELKVAMVVRDKATALTTNPKLLNPKVPEPGGAGLPAAVPATQSGVATEPGMMERTLEGLKRALPAAEVLREDLTSLPNGNRSLENNVGILNIRYTVAGKRRLAQQALIQASDRVFYVLTLTSPGKPTDAGDADDPREVTAVNTFRQVLDSVTLLDRASIRRDQEDRLYCTRTLFVNFTPARLQGALIKEQWQRMVQNGKDIGYTYICEQQAGDIPRLGQAPPKLGVTQHIEIKKPLIPPGSDILIGIRSRTITDGVRSDKTRGPIVADTESWLFSSLDRNHEEWSREVRIDDRLNGPDGKPKKPLFMEELGDSNKRLKEVMLPVPEGATLGSKPEMVTKTDYQLNVGQVNAGAAIPPLTRQLPPFYTPEAISLMLPRLLPLHEPRGYMFATYVGDAHEVMMRYVDVLPQQAVNILGKNQMAVPIDDRLGIDGSVTTHYFSPAGKFLGSQDKDSDLWIIPSDSDTIQKIWSDNALLTVPNAVQNRHNETAAQ